KRIPWSLVRIQAGPPIPCADTAGTQFPRSTPNYPRSSDFRRPNEAQFLTWRLLIQQEPAMLKPVLILTATSFLAVAVFASSSQDQKILASARRTQLEFRAGNLEVAKPLVKMLEDATARSRKNAELWEALGFAYMSLQGSMYAGPPDMPSLISAGEHARHAFSRSLALNPK